MSKPFDKYTCTVCSQTFRSPKILPCFHTFCEPCLHDLVQRSGSNAAAFECPQCRQTISVPEGGASHFQPNVYIQDKAERLRNDGIDTCTEHPQKRLRLFCRTCDRPICRLCKLATHEWHQDDDVIKAITHAKAELAAAEKRLTEHLGSLGETINVVVEQKRFVNDKRRTLEQTIHARADTLIAWVNESRQTALKSLEVVTSDILAHLDSSAILLEDCFQSTESGLQALRSRLTMISCQATFRQLENVRQELKREPQLRQLTSDCQTFAEHPALLSEVICNQRKVFDLILGQAIPVRTKRLPQKFSINTAFCCSDSVLAEVCSILPLESEKVWVAHCASQAGDDGQVALYSQAGVVLKQEPVTGRVSLNKIKNGWVQVDGQSFKPRFLSPQKSISATYNGPEREYDVFCKLDPRFKISVPKNGKCELRSVKIKNDEIPATTSKYICNISATQAVAMDASSDGKLFAILEKGKDHVLLYHHGDGKPYATYRADSAVRFKPRDVCFYVVGGRERLIVADWLGDSLHVLHVDGGCRFLGQLGLGYTQLIKPTTLTADTLGRLWIGCQGGSVLFLQPTMEEKQEKQPTTEAKQEKQPTMEEKQEKQPTMEEKRETAHYGGETRETAHYGGETRETAHMEEKQEKQPTMEEKQEKQPTTEEKQEKQPTMEEKQEKQPTMEEKR